MSWQYDVKNHRAFDDESGIYLVKAGNERDNFRFSIRKIFDNSLCFSFEARPDSTQDLEGVQKIDHPGFDEITTWLVVDSGLNPSQKEHIARSLLARANRLEGKYSRYLEGVWRRSLVEIKYVDHLEGY